MREKDNSERKFFLVTSSSGARIYEDFKKWEFKDKDCFNSLMAGFPII